MTEEQVEVVRQKVRHRTRRRRALDERLALLAPGVAIRLGVLTRRRLPPNSRLRRAMLARVLCLQYEGVNRRDFELVEIFYSPDLECVYEHVQELPLDLPAIDRGRDAMRRWAQLWDDVWDDSRSTVEEVIDTSGDQMGAIIRVGGRGKGSGIEIEQELTEIFTLRDGLVVRFVVFADRAQGLATLGSQIESANRALIG